LFRQAGSSEEGKGMGSRKRRFPAGMTNKKGKRRFPAGMTNKKSKG
jgi:hypothetical protein